MSTQTTLYNDFLVKGQKKYVGQQLMIVMLLVLGRLINLLNWKDHPN